MEQSTVKNYFETPGVVADYADAVDSVGLWRSEEIVVEKFARKDSAILELGCGAGRIGINLSRLGYSNILMADISENMVAAANEAAKREGLSARAEARDAASLPYPGESFDTVIFGFNGIMQIPKKEKRLAAFREIARVLKAGGAFIFTTHDRDLPANSQYWSSEKKQWQCGSNDPRLDDFGDIFYKGDHGNIFIHSPSKDEILGALEAAGLKPAFARRRSEIAEEPAAVLEFSDDCIFWVAAKPQPQNIKI